MVETRESPIVLVGLPLGNTSFHGVVIWNHRHTHPGAGRTFSLLALNTIQELVGPQKHLPITDCRRAIEIAAIGVELISRELLELWFGGQYEGVTGSTDAVQPLADQHRGGVERPSAEATATAVAETLTAAGLLSDAPDAGTLRCYASDNPQRFAALGSRFLGRPLRHSERGLDLPPIRRRPRREVLRRPDGSFQSQLDHQRARLANISWRRLS